MISDNAKIWIWITQAIGYNNPKVKSLYALYNNIADFYNGGDREWRFCGLLSQTDITNLSKTDLAVAQSILDRCAELNYSVVSIDDEAFPQCLRDIDTPPAVLYVNGNLPDVDNRLTIGVVGTRRATKYGLDNSYKIGYALSKYGVTIISGGALGVDCASHRGALGADGVTICVRGCGINSKYLSDNAEMRKAITKRGAVISEYPPDEEPRNYYFPARNRIISALSDGVVIIESGIKSGSLITANLALEQGKEVFALLGNNNPQNEGSNARIKEGTAIPITDFMDIINSFENLYATSGEVDFENIRFEDIEAIPVKGRNPFLDAPKPIPKDLEPTIPARSVAKPARQASQNSSHKPTVSQKNSLPTHKQNINLNSTAALVYNYISNEPIHIDKISTDLKLPVFKVLTAISQLEMQGLITALQGRRYVLK